jgi:hypothetical protein
MTRHLPNAEGAPAGYVELEAAAPWERGPPPEQPRSEAPKFVLERWRDIRFDGGEEWAIKRILPRVGLAAIYGKPGSLKSFVAAHIGLSAAQEWPWAGRRVARCAALYIAAEGAAGLRKRKAGYVKAYPELPPDVPFSLISAAPNLGADPGDLPALIAAIENAGVSPGLIVLDTLAQTLGAADENGVGMTAFVANARTLAQRFNALVLIVHHVGLVDDKRMRGHSSLNGALDAQILCERKEGELAATLTLQKLKDDASDVRLSARMSRIVIGYDEDDEEISTLIVEAVVDADSPGSAPRSKSVPPSQRLLMAVVGDVLDEMGADFQPFGSTGPKVRAAAEQHIRERYFTRVAERADPDEDKEKLQDRQRQAFKRAIKAAIDAQSLVAADHRGERLIWLPR